MGEAGCNVLALTVNFDGKAQSHGQLTPRVEFIIIKYDRGEIVIINEDFIEVAGGKRTSIVRKAMVQAGNKLRVIAIKRLFVNIGSCMITFSDIERMNLSPDKIDFGFCRGTVTYVMLDPVKFKMFPRILNCVDLEVAMIKNGIIGILDSEPPHAGSQDLRNA